MHTLEERKRNVWECEVKWTRSESENVGPFFLDHRPGWMERVPQKDVENSLKKYIFFNNIGFDIKGELLFEFHSK